MKIIKKFFQEKSNDNFNEKQTYYNPFTGKKVPFWQQKKMEQLEELASNYGHTANDFIKAETNKYIKEELVKKEKLKLLKIIWIIVFSILLALMIFINNINILQLIIGWILVGIFLITYQLIYFLIKLKRRNFYH